MRVLVGGCTADTAARMRERPDRLGVLMTPRASNHIATAEAAGAMWAADNDCFQGLKPVQWLRFLAKVVESGSPPVFVACPDALADAETTRRMYDLWAPVLRSLGLPVAYVLQDGLERWNWRLFFPWAEVAAVFVGGSTAWKEGPHAAAVVAEAKRQGKWVHGGRVCTQRRIRRFAELGADSIDCSEVNRQQGKFVPLVTRWIDAALRDLAAQPSLFAEGES